MRENMNAKKEDGRQSDSTPPNCSGNPLQPKRPKQCDFWNVVPTCDGITDSIHNEHVAELNKECQKPPTKQDKTKQNEDTATEQFDIKAVCKRYIDHQCAS